MNLKCVRINEILIMHELQSAYSRGRRKVSKGYFSSELCGREYGLLAGGAQTPQLEAAWSTGWGLLDILYLS